MKDNQDPILQMVNEQSSIFYCQHILDGINNIADLMTFKVDHQEGSGLVEYLQRASIYEEDANLNRTYIVRDKKDNDIVGFFSLKCGLASTNEHKNSENSQNIFDTVPAIELANFAVNNSYKEKYPDNKGIGATIFMNFILPIVEYVAKYVGISILILYALPYDNLINYYQKLGFSRLNPEAEQLLHSRIKPVYDGSCIFMFQKI